MRESWRWFGPDDPVTIADIRQTGATDIVSALHAIPAGDVWPLADIQAHKAMIEGDNADSAPLHWTVVESIPVHEDIKLARPGHEKYIDAWAQSMENLAQCGITRTDLNYKLPSGAYALRFDQQKFAAFDLFILKRENAESEYSEAEIEDAKRVFDAMSETDRTELTNNIIAGLPGKMTESYGLDDFKTMLSHYKDVDTETLRRNLFSFLDHASFAQRMIWTSYSKPSLARPMA